MAMINYDINEFLSQAITDKAAGRPVSDQARRRAMRSLEEVADKAIDVGIMKAVMSNCALGVISRKQVSELEEYMKRGDKEATGRYLEKICPEVDEFIVEELARFKDMYLHDERPRELK